MKIPKILVGLGGRCELSMEASPRCEELATSTSGHVIGTNIFTQGRFVLSFTCYGYVEAKPNPLWTLASKVVQHSSFKTTL